MKYYILICLLAILSVGCKKDEFTLPSEGKQIPFEDTLTVSFTDALKQSAAQRFYKAWQRSHMQHLLDSLSTGKNMFTILALSDAALDQKGYTEQVLMTMDISELDSLLMFYTLHQRITKEDLTNRQDDYTAISLLNRPGIRAARFLNGTPGTFVSDPYYYRQHLQVKDGKTIVNGKVVGTGLSITARNGYIWLLDQMIIKTEKTVLETIETDGRFTMLLGIIRETWKLHDSIYNAAWGAPPKENPTSTDFYLSYGWMITPDEEFGTNAGPNITFSTFFLPTDDAFRAVGFNSVADLMAFNRRRGLPYFDWNTYTMVGLIATSQMLDYHLNWGLVVNKVYPIYLNGTIVFYSNMLTSSTVANYPIMPKLGDPNGSEPDGAYYMPYVFREDGAGKIQLNVKNAEAPAATIVNADINTLMGPIHVVDRLLLPKGFKID